MAYTTKGGSSDSGSMLTVFDIDQIAAHVADMWCKFNNERQNALSMNQEARQYIYATDIDQTSAGQLNHKNRTHQPKLTEIADKLKSKYYEASLSMPKFFRFDGNTLEDSERAKDIEDYIRAKLEQRKFRETVGRQLINDYVDFGNCFAAVDYIVEKNSSGDIVYRGPEVRRISPLDIVFNPRAASFRKSPKLERFLVHVAEVAEFTDTYPDARFDGAAISKALEYRHSSHVDDWVEVIKESGLQMDGYGSWDEYFKQDMAEILIYRGDVFDPNTGVSQRNRVVYVMDRCHVIRNEPSKSPTGYDGLHNAGWRSRPDNLWSQGPLDTLVGMQYRIDHLENLKADIFDQIARPVLKIKGESVIEPAEGYAPGAVYVMGMEEDVEALKPDTTALNADTQISVYHQLMDTFAGAPPEERGIRTPGEKTAFEVDKLSTNAGQMFVDKARIFERMLETLLKEIFELCLINFSEDDYVKVMNDETKLPDALALSRLDFTSRGNFVATGARHWERRQRQMTEIQTFMQSIMTDPKIRAHVSGERLANYIESRMDLEDENIIEAFAGVKEDVHIQAIAQAEAEAFKRAAGGQVAAGDATGTGTEVFPGPESQEGSPIPGAGSQ